MKPSENKPEAFKQGFEIPISGLKEKQYEFKYNIKDDFLAAYETSTLTTGKLKVKLKLDKRPNFFVLKFRIKGWLEVECDRCSEPFEMPFKSKRELIAKLETGLGVGKLPEDDIDIIYLKPDAVSLNVADLIHEFIELGLPLKKVHPKDADGKSGCNPKVLEILKKSAAPPKKEEDDIDPRWQALKNLKK